jgi:hypothetical protein
MRAAVRQVRVSAAAAMLIASSNGPTPPYVGETVCKVPFNFQSAFPLVLQTLAPGTLLNRAAILVTAPFNSAARLKLGTSATPGLLFDVGEVSLADLGTYDTAELVSVSMSDLLLLDVIGATQGAGVLLYKYR